jgi:hypothetical protein
MPVTSRSLLIRQVNGAGKKAPTNLRFDPTRRQTVNLSCDCRPEPPPVLPPVLPPEPVPVVLPGPVIIEYTVAGSYTNTLGPLPDGYVWRVNGVIISGGGGGGGGGGGVILGFNFSPGAGGRTFNMVFSVPLSATFPGGASITSIVGAGGAGGSGGAPSMFGGNGSFGTSSSVTYNTTIISSPPAIGGLGGFAGPGSPIGQIGGIGPGSSGSGGNGSTISGSPGSPGKPGADGRIFFTATPFQI